MSDRSSIEWLNGGATWNPIRARNKATGKVGWFCEHASDLCKNCYAERMNQRVNAAGEGIGNGIPYQPVHRRRVEVFVDDGVVLLPLKWTTPRLVFPCSMTDLFGEWVTDEMIDLVFAAMALAGGGEEWVRCRRRHDHDQGVVCEGPERAAHTFLSLTKRPWRARMYLSHPERLARITAQAERMPNWSAMPGFRINWPLPNLWLGYSGADAAGVGELLRAPAALRWLSIEPLLAPVDITRHLHDSNCMYGVPRIHCVCGPPREDCIDWVVTGAESGPKARPMDLNWVRSLRDQCQGAGVPFFFKQDAVNGRKVPTPELDGRRWVEFPRPRK